MKYLDNLIAWGDQLFRRDTIESINEATQLYVLAAEILGPRPRAAPAARSARRVETLQRARAAARRLLERARRGREPGARPDAAWCRQRRDRRRCTLPAMLYFCVPQNDKLLGYWDTVADRLFKIRHCMNIEGVVRQLPLFEPPIDPALLVRAAAAGLDLGSVLADVRRAGRRPTASSRSRAKATELVQRGEGARRSAALRAREARRRGALAPAFDARDLSAEGGTGGAQAAGGGGERRARRAPEVAGARPDPP